MTDRKQLAERMTAQQRNEISAHDHSSAEAGGTILQPSDLVTAESPLVDVRQYGVVGDGTTDDTAALQAAVDAATPRGVLFVPSTFDVRFEETIDIDLEATDEAIMDGTAEQTPFALLCHGRLTPAAGIGDGLHLHHAVEPYVFVRFHEGGGDVETDHALHVTDTLGGVYEGFARFFDGTVFTFTRGDTRLAGVVVDYLRASVVGRELLMAGEPDAPLGAESGVGSIEDVWGLPELGMEFRHVKGLKIDQYENVVGPNLTTRGNRFESCENVIIDKFAVGGSAEIDELVEFRNCRNLQVGAIFAHAMPGTGVVIDSVEHAQFDRIFVNTQGEIGVDYRQTGELETGENRIQIDTMGTAGRCLLIREEVTGSNHYFTGTFVGSNDPTTVETRDAERIVFHDATLEGALGDDPALAIPEENDVYLANVDVDGIEGRPRLQNGMGRATGVTETPNASEWPTGSVVEYTPESGESTTALYQLFPSGWVRLADAPAEFDTSASDNDDSLPGPGLLASIGTLGGAAYLWRQLRDDDIESVESSE